MILEVDGLSHRYGESLAVDDVTFGMESGELLGLIGPSGCGKTTVVQAIAGHVGPTAGRIRLRDDDVTAVPPEARRVGVVFQRSTLFPHMSVGENVAYGLGNQGSDSETRAARVAEYLDLVDLAGHRDDSPEALSGGQRRRVELARALAPEPDVLLLDEPLSALDRSLRHRLREEIGEIQRETGVTTLFVTHDQNDAMALSDRLVVMSEGRVAADGPPGALYDDPPSSFVASFLGRSNELDLSADALWTHAEPTETAPDAIPTSGLADSDPGTTWYVRPEDVHLAPDAHGAGVRLEGVVTRIGDLGKRYDVVLTLASGDQLVAEHRGEPPELGEDVVLTIDKEDLVAFDGNGDQVEGGGAGD
jgi:putative spermidine/putrescine transport system ATP-binding protein/molybdate/tungstate transport system ATP-binding protein